MHKIHEHIVSFTHKHWFMLFLAISVLVMVFVTRLSQLKIDGEIDAWYKNNDKAYLEYNDFLNHFGDDRSLILAYKSDSLFSESEIQYNRQLCDSLSKIDGVKKVFGLTNIKIPVISPFVTAVRKLIPARVSNFTELQKQVVSQPIFIDNIISSSAKATAIQIIPERKANFKAIYNSVNDLVNKQKYPERFIVTGGMALIVEAETISSIEPPLFLLLAVIIIILIVYFLFKHWLLAILPVVISIISIVITLGLMQLTGVSINMITGIIPLVLLATGIAFPIHFISRYTKTNLEIQDSKKTSTTVLKHIFVPGGLSALTTSLAFLAFLASDIQPIKQFGLFSAIGVSASFVISLLVLPVFMRKISVAKRSLINKNHVSEFGKKLALFSTHYSVKILVFCGILLVITLFGILQLNLESDNIKYFKPTSDLRKANDSASVWFEGIYPYEILLNTENVSKDSIYFYFGVLQKIEKELLMLDEIKICHSANGYFQAIKNLNRYQISDSLLVSAFVEGQIEKKITENLNDYITADFSRYRISAKSQWVNNQKALHIIHKMDSVLNSNLKSTSVSYHISGSACMFLNLNNKILKAQKNSLILSFLFIFSVLMLIFRKPVLFMAGLLPNILPILNTLGLMGFLSIPLDVGTILVASVSLGIAVDDTMYFLKTYQTNCLCMNAKEAIIESLRQVWKPLSLTTLLLICGFIIMIFSTYTPILYMGIFISINLSFALLYDLIVLPALLHVMHRKH